MHGGRVPPLYGGILPHLAMLHGQSKAVMRVLRLVGARDAYIAGAFVRRFALRSLIGGGCGAALGIGALLVFPNQASAQSFMVGLSFSGLEWLLPLIIPVMIAFVSFQATKAAAFRTLRGMP
ncbi:FtsX-like permease family protein [Roseobacter sp. HKCCD5988]|uniref:FtsX-like permease family protein n=1 Tax=Roseobacter sp. HKCCD5988 TaxID=3120338 RepID=UPI0030EE04B3